MDTSNQVKIIKKASWLIPPSLNRNIANFDFIVSSNEDKVMMLEGGFCETPEDIVKGAIEKAKAENRKNYCLY